MLMKTNIYYSSNPAAHWICMRIVLYDFMNKLNDASRAHAAHQHPGRRLNNLNAAARAEPMPTDAVALAFVREANIFGASHIFNVALGESLIEMSR